MKFKTTEIVECPNVESWDFHKLTMGHLMHIARRNHLKPQFRIVNESKFHFEFISEMDDTMDQQNALIEIMEYLTQNNIDPGKVINRKMECDNVNQTLEILENV